MVQKTESLIKGLGVLNTSWGCNDTENYIIGCCAVILGGFDR